MGLYENQSKILLKLSRYHKQTAKSFIYAKLEILLRVTFAVNYATSKYKFLSFHQHIPFFTGLQCQTLQMKRQSFQSREVLESEDLKDV